MLSTRTSPSIFRSFKELISTPIDSFRHWGVIIVIALMFAFIPQVRPPNDWERNALGLLQGLSIYQDSNAVYPPWALILLWPYYFMTAAGSRIASVFVIGWLSAQQKWTLLHFGMIIAYPYFLWTMAMSNLDVLALVLPIVLWESAAGKAWQWLGMGASFIILMIKPQGGLLMVFYFIWQKRHQLKTLILPFLMLLLVVLPISLMGKPPLFYQWLDNIVFNPSEQNLLFWQINNVSLTSRFGFWPGILIFGLSMGGLVALMRFKQKPWTQNHTYASIFLISVLFSPYASNQSMIVPLAFLPSWPALLIQYVFSFTLSFLGVYQQYSGLWALLFGIFALWFYQSAQDGGRISPQEDSTTSSGNG